MSDIDIITCLANGSYGYARKMRASLLATQSGQHRFHWKAVTSNTEEVTSDFDIVASEGDYHHPSLSHAMALNEAVKHVTSEYAVIVDCDIAVLLPNWDEYMLKELNNGFSCFGWANGDNEPKFHNFPSVYFFGFRKDMLDKVTLDFRPELVEGQLPVLRRPVETDEESSLLGIRKGTQLKCDTGWRLPLDIKGAGLRGLGLQKVLGGSRDSKLPFLSDEQRSFCRRNPALMAEWHYGGELFGTHLLESRNYPVHSKTAAVWFSRINQYLKQKTRKTI